MRIVVVACLVLATAAVPSRTVRAADAPAPSPTPSPSPAPAPAPDAAPASPPPVDLDAVVATLSNEIRRRMAAEHVPAVSIALVRGDAVVWTGAFGVANVWAKTPATPDTVFSTGSTFKPVVAATVLALVDEGKLSLDARVADLLPDVKVKTRDGWPPITVRHLLSHTSGLPRGALTVPIWDRRLPPAIEETAALVEASFPAGTGVAYSNLAFGLLGRIVEKAAGEPFEDAVRRRVFVPLGMGATTLVPSAAVVERMALPYARSETGVEPLRQVRFDMFPAGDVWTTAADMGRFLAALLNDGRSAGGRILSPEAARSLRTRPFFAERAPEGFGLGIYVEEREGRVVLAHSGSVPGFVAALRGDVGARVGAYVLANQDGGGPALDALARIACRLLRGEAYTPFDPAVARRDPVPAAWATFAGTYLSPQAGPIRVRVEDGALVMEAGGRKAWLVPDGDAGDRFVARGDDSQDGAPVAFLRDGAGKVVGVRGRSGVPAERLATDAATTMDVSKAPEGTLEGAWEGSAGFGGLRLDFALHVRRDGERLVATVTVPAQGLKDSPVSQLLHHGAQIHFEHGAGGALALVDGVLEGDVLRGTLRRSGFALPVEAYRVGSDAAKAAAARRAAGTPAPPAAPTPPAVFVGAWEGGIDVGPSRLRIRLDVASDTRATLSIPEQGLDRGALEAVRRDGTRVHFELASSLGQAVFDGELRGDVLVGTLAQSGATMAFELRRVPASPPVPHDAR